VNGRREGRITKAVPLQYVHTNSHDLFRATLGITARKIRYTKYKVAMKFETITVSFK
jgi:hypothetical protein